MFRLATWPVVLGLLAAAAAGGVFAVRVQLARPARLLAEGRAALGRGELDRAARCADLLDRYGQPSFRRLLRAEMAVRAARPPLAAGAPGPQRVQAEAACRRALGELARIRGGPVAGEVTVLAAEC